MQLQKRRLRTYETLEKRYALAGDVTTTLVDGVLTITGDAEANGISLVSDSVTPGKFTLTGIDAGGSATAIDGVDNDTVEFTDVESVVIVMNEGNDIVEIPYINFAGDVSINGGAGEDSVTIATAATQSLITADLLINTEAGNDSVTLGRLEMSGDLTVDTGADNDTVTVDGNATKQFKMAGDAVFTLGDGTNSLKLSNYVQSQGSLTVTGGAAVDTLVFGDTFAVSVNGKVTIDTAADADTINFKSFTYTKDLDADLLTINTGAGNDVLTFGDAVVCSFEGNVVIDTGADADTVTLKNFDYSMKDNTDKLTISTGTGNDILTFGDSAACTIEGDVVIDTGADADTVSLKNFKYSKKNSTDKLSISTGTGDDTLTAGDTLPCIFEGNVVIDTGADADTITLKNFRYTKTNNADKLSISTGAGNDKLTAGETLVCTFEGSVAIDMGADADTVSLVSVTYIAVSATDKLLVNLGTGVDSLTFGSTSGKKATLNGNVEINGGDGNDTIAFPVTDVTGNLVVNGDGGDDTITFGTTGTTAKKFKITGDTTVKTDDGIDQVRFFQADLNGKLAVDTGAGNDTVALGTLERVVNVNGEISIRTGAALDAIRFNNTVTIGKMTIDSGDGDDTVAFGTSTKSAKHTGNLNIRTGLGLDTINMQFFSVTNPIPVVSDSDAPGLYINGGDGNDTITLGTKDHPSSVSGPLAIRGGVGNDTITMQYFNHAGSTIINTGDGTDTVILGSDDANSGTITGRLSIRTEAGTKTITQTNVNIVGTQDVSAEQTNNDGTASNAQNVTISKSTFGSFLYFDFGGRAASLKMDNVVQTGSLFVYNRVDTAPATNGDDRVIVPVAQNFTFSYVSSSMAGGLTLDSTARGLYTINNATIVGSADLKSLGSTNSLSVSNSSVNTMQFISRETYTVSDAVFPVIKNERVVESTNDTVNLTNVTVNGTTNLESAGSLTLNGVQSGLTVLSALNNTLGFIRTNASRFTDLIVRLGSTAHPNETGATSSDSTETDVTNAEITNSVVTGTLTLDSTSRVKSIQFFTAQGILEQGTAINRARANYSVIGSQIGALNMPAVNDSAKNVVADAVPGVNFINISNSTLTSVSLALPKSNDTVNISGSYVAASAYLNGGGGNNLLNRNNSTINGLQKVNFAN